MQVAHCGVETAKVLAELLGDTIIAEDMFDKSLEVKGR
jgi:hypothetical protein